MYTHTQKGENHLCPKREIGRKKERERREKQKRKKKEREGRREGKREEGRGRKLLGENGKIRFLMTYCYLLCQVFSASLCGHLKFNPLRIFR